MTLVRYAEPPAPPEDAAWCAMCLMLAKNKIFKEHEARIKTAWEDGRQDEIWIPWDNSIKLLPARYHTYSDMPQLGALLLCWTHVTGIDMAPTPALVQPGQIPAGLLRGRVP